VNKQAILNRTTMVIGICYGGGGGLSSTVLTQLNQLMCSRNYTTGLHYCFLPRGLGFDSQRSQELSSEKLILDVAMIYRQLACTAGRGRIATS